VPIIPCDVGCPDGACAPRAGTPVVIATGPAPDRVAALAVGFGSLYYGTIAQDIFTGGQLRKIVLETGESTVAVDGVQVSRISIAGDGTAYYITNELQSAGQRLNALSGDEPPILRGLFDSGLAGLWVGSGLYLDSAAEPEGGAIYAEQWTPSSSTEAGWLVRTLSGTLHGLGADDRFVYWGEGDGPSQLLFGPQAGPPNPFDEPATMLATSADQVISDPLVDGDDVYFRFAHTPGECAGAVMVVPKAGGASRTVSLGQTGSDVSSFAVDEAFVYWTTPDAGGFVFRAGKSGGAPEVIAQGQASARLVTTDDTRIYWVAAGARGDEVRAVAKVTP
jgi:hypothetical protein